MKRMMIACWLALTLVGAADNVMVGRWRASGGYKVQIPADGQSFELIFEDAKGQKIRHPAHWVTPGQEFSWVDKQKTQHTARLEPTHKPIRIKDVNFDYPDSPAYWYRLP